MSISKPPPIPQAGVPIVVAQSGLMQIDWFKFFSQTRDRLVSIILMFGTGSTTVAALPSAATVGAGARAFVTDATSSTFHNTVVGGGSTKVPVVSDGTNWLIG
jgi:hypothetical protein